MKNYDKAQRIKIRGRTVVVGGRYFGKVPRTFFPRKFTGGGWTEQ